MNEKVSLKDMAPLIEEIINGDAKVTLIASGVSMEPFIHNNKDTVTLRKPSQKLKKGDIPFYKRSNGQFILHRVVGEDENGYILCGDNQWVKEYGVKEEQIIAVLVSVGKNGKEYSTDSFYFKAFRFFLPVIKWSRRIKNSVYIRLKRSK